MRYAQIRESSLTLTRLEQPRMLNILAGRYIRRKNVTLPLAQPPCPSKEKSERYSLPNISAYPDSSGAKAVMLPRIRINRVCEAKIKVRL